MTGVSTNQGEAISAEGGQVMINKKRTKDNQKVRKVLKTGNK